MTSKTIFLNYILGERCQLYYLLFPVRQKNECILCAAVPLEGPFAHEIFVRNMTINAVGDFPVASSFPRSIFGNHYMAVDTGFRLFIKVAWRIKKDKKGKPKAKKSADRREYGNA